MSNLGTPLSAPINVTNTGNTTVIAAVGGMPLTVWKLNLTANADTSITFQDTDGNVKTGAYSLTAFGSLTLPYDGAEWFRIGNGAGLVVHQSGTASIQGIVVYRRG